MGKKKKPELIPYEDMGVCRKLMVAIKVKEFIEAGDEKPSQV